MKITGILIGILLASANCFAAGQGQTQLIKSKTLNIFTGGFAKIPNGFIFINKNRGNAYFATEIDENLRPVKDVRLLEYATNVVTDFSGKNILFRQVEEDGRLYSLPHIKPLPVRMTIVHNKYLFNGAYISQALSFESGNAKRDYIKCGDGLVQVVDRVTNSPLRCKPESLGFPSHMRTNVDGTISLFDVAARTITHLLISRDYSELKFMREFHLGFEPGELVALDANSNSLVGRAALNGSSEFIYSLNVETGKLLRSRLFDGNVVAKTIESMHYDPSRSVVHILSYRRLLGAVDLDIFDLRTGASKSRGSLTLFDVSAVNQPAQSYVRTLKADYDTGQFVMAVGDINLRGRQVEPALMSLDFPKGMAVSLWNYGLFDRMGDRTPDAFSSLGSNGLFAGVSDRKNEIFGMDLKTKSYFQSLKISSDTRYGIYFGPILAAKDGRAFAIFNTIAPVAGEYVDFFVLTP